MRHVFISYATKDGGDVANQLVVALEADGCACWIAPRDVKAGIPYPGQIVSAIEASAGLVALLTPAAAKSPDVLQEVQIAHSVGVVISPILMEHTELSPDLRYYVGVRHAISWQGADKVARAVSEVVKTALASRVQVPELVRISLPSYSMGSAFNNPRHLHDEIPQRSITLDYTLDVGKYPITIGQWRNFVAATDRKTQSGSYVFNGTEWVYAAEARWDLPGFPVDDAHPATCLSWRDAKDYSSWLSLGVKRPIRLLTEAEWECACRANTKSEYSVGDHIQTSQANFGGTLRGTARVGSYSPNGFGLFEMHGNVNEWVQDHYEADYASGQPSDGSAHQVPWRPDIRNVIRGGSWVYSAMGLRSAARYSLPPEQRYADLGFRIACDLE